MYQAIGFGVILAFGIATATVITIVELKDTIEPLPIRNGKPDAD